MIIGFTGAIGAGKSSAADALRMQAKVPHANLEYNQPIMAIANAWMDRIGGHTKVTPKDLITLHEVVKEQGIHVPVTSFTKLVYPELTEYMMQRRKLQGLDRIVSMETKAMHRFLLQWLGHQITYVDEDFWTKAIHVAADKLSQEGIKLITICGVRYDSNARAIRTRGGHVLEVRRPSLGDVMPSYNTELGISNGYISATVINDGNLEDLNRKMLRIWQDIEAQALKSEY